MGRFDWVLHRSSHSGEKAARAQAVQPLRVLVVGMDRQTSFRIAHVLQDAGHWVRCGSTVRAAFAAAEAATFDVLIVNQEMADGSASRVVTGIQQLWPMPAVAVTPTAGLTQTPRAEFAAQVDRALLVSKLLPALAAATAPARRASVAAEALPV